MGPKKEGFSHSHIAYESQLIVASSLREKKNLQKSQVHAWCLFDIHDICLIPPKKIFDKLLSTSIFSAFFQAAFNPSLKNVRRRRPAFWDPGLWCTQRHLAANGLGRLGGGKTMLASGIDLFSFKLPPKTSHPMVYPSSRLHTSDVGVHVLPHLPSREALRCPPWHLRCFVHKEKLVTKRAET